MVHSASWGGAETVGYGRPMKTWRRPPLTVNTLVVAASIIGCGSGGEAKTVVQTVTVPPTATPAATATPAPKPKPRVRLQVYNRLKITERTSVVITGIVTRGAKVTVRGLRAEVKKGRFRKTLKLTIGSDRFTVVARHPDRRTVTKRVRIKRVLPLRPRVRPHRPCPHRPALDSTCTSTRDQGQLFSAVLV